jgi:cell division control protein 6
MAAKEEGDARYALDLLRTAGEIADEKETDVVQGEYVREAKDKIEHNKITDLITTLPTQQQRVLESVLKLTEKKKYLSTYTFVGSYNICHYSHILVMCLLQ